MGLLRTILFLLVGYYLLRLLSVWLAPKLFAYAAKRAEARFREAFGTREGGNDNNSNHIGDISVQKKTANNNKEGKKVGEYIEFEEIE